MNQMTKRIVQAEHAEACGQHVACSDRGDSRTLSQRYLLEMVLPAVTLLSISALTVVTIVVLVTTVAQAGWLAPGSYVNVDPWSGLSPEAAVPHQDSSRWPASVSGQVETGGVSLGPQAGTDNGYFTARMLE